VHPANWVSDHPHFVRNAISFGSQTVCCFMDSVSMQWRQWFVFFIMIDTLYVYHRPVFSPKKWHWTQVAIVVILCFYLPPKSKFVMICILSTSRWITREWRLLCGPHFCCSCSVQRHSVSPRQLLCDRSPSLFQSEQMVYCAICNLLFFAAHFGRMYLETRNVTASFFLNVVLHETVNVSSTANPGRIAQRLIGGDSPWSSARWIWLWLFGAVADSWWREVKLICLYFVNTQSMDLVFLFVFFWILFIGFDYL